MKTHAIQRDFKEIRHLKAKESAEKYMIKNTYKYLL